MILSQMSPQWIDIAPAVTGGIVSTICLILLFNFLKHSAKQALDMKSLQIELICVQKLLLLEKLDMRDGATEDEICDKCRDIAAKALSSIESQRQYMERVYAVESRQP